MKNKKALVFGETIGLDKNFVQSHSKPTRSETQPAFKFAEPQTQNERTLPLIECYECHRRDALDGYRFRLVPLCRCCRTMREVEITRNQFERRMKK